MPESVCEVVERRVEVLSTDGRQTLTAAAVIGRSFDLDLLAALVDLDEVTLLEQLEAAVQASLLVESSDRVGRFSFAHALINHALYNGLGGTRRARMHLQIAEDARSAIRQRCGGALSGAGVALAVGDRIGR